MTQVDEWVKMNIFSTYQNIFSTTCSVTYQKICSVKYQNKIFSSSLSILHSKKFLGRRQENAEVRNGKMQFCCFRPTFGVILTNFTCFRPTFGPIWTNFCLKQENCIFPFRTSAFSCRRPKIVFECNNIDR